jgi:hypothetical protein
VWQLAQDKKLLKFGEFWNQMDGPSYARLELTAGIKRDED